MAAIPGSTVRRSLTHLLPRWLPESALELMDSQEIATGILSLTAPVIVIWDKSDRREMARFVNEYTADQNSFQRVSDAAVTYGGRSDFYGMSTTW